MVRNVDIIYTVKLQIFFINNGKSIILEIFNIHPKDISNINTLQIRVKRTLMWSDYLINNKENINKICTQ